MAAFIPGGGANDQIIFDKVRADKVINIIYQTNEKFSSHQFRNKLSLILGNFLHTF
jgi:hypothetical protein